MKLIFEGVVPDPLTASQISESSIWAKSLELDSGQRLQISAASGSGKTTFLKIIYGLRADYTGTVSLGDQIAHDLTPKEWALLRQEQLSFVFQDLALLEELTARQNLELKAALTSFPKWEDIAERYAEELGVHSQLDRTVASLSQGERQRFAIIRSLLQPFSWLLLDEPFSHLDAANTRQAIRILEEETSKRGAGMVLTQLDPQQIFTGAQILAL